MKTTTPSGWSSRTWVTARRPQSTSAVFEIPVARCGSRITFTPASASRRAADREDEVPADAGTHRLPLLADRLAREQDQEQRHQADSADRLAGAEPPQPPAVEATHLAVVTNVGHAAANSLRPSRTGSR